MTVGRKTGGGTKDTPNKATADDRRVLLSPAAWLTRGTAMPEGAAGNPLGRNAGSRRGVLEGFPGGMAAAWPRGG
jgi:hypothetical protein